jgi:hypothetical protein
VSDIRRRRFVRRVCRDPRPRDRRRRGGDAAVNAGLGGDLGDGRDEAVTAPRNSGDEPGLRGIVSQRPSQRQDALRKEIFRDRPIGPDEADELFLADDTISGRDEGQQGVEGLCTEDDDLVVAQQVSCGFVEPETAENVRMSRVQPPEPAILASGLRSIVVQFTTMVMRSWLRLRSSVEWMTKRWPSAVTAYRLR